MRRIIIAASVLLVIQIGLVFYANTTDMRYEAFSPGSTLFTFSPESVSSVTFTDENRQQLTLVKENGSWRLAVQSTPPADENRVKAFLEKLAGMKESLAVATSKGAARRFKVSDDLFESHTIVKQGERNVVDLYVGTSPGVRHVHARVAGQENIISVPLSSFNLSPTVENWVDKEMLQVKEEDLQEIKMETFTLDQKDGKWRLKDTDEKFKVNGEEVKKLVDKITGLNIQTILDKEEVDSSVMSKEPHLQYSLILKDKKNVTYSFTQSDESYYVLRVSGREPLFKIGGWLVDDIAAFSKEKLIETVQAEN